MKILKKIHQTEKNFLQIMMIEVGDSKLDFQ